MSIYFVQMARNMIQIGKRIWMLGVGLVGSTVCVGNVWNGAQLSKSDIGIGPFVSGITFGITKGIGYGCASWGFVFYAWVRHQHRVAIAMRDGDYNFGFLYLKAHYQNHFIPNSRMLLYGETLLKASDDKGDAVRQFLLNKNIILRTQDVSI